MRWAGMAVVLAALQCWQEGSEQHMAAGPCQPHCSGHAGQVADARGVMVRKAGMQLHFRHCSRQAQSCRTTVSVLGKHGSKLPTATAAAGPLQGLRGHGVRATHKDISSQSAQVPVAAQEAQLERQRHTCQGLLCLHLLPPAKQPCRQQALVLAGSGQQSCV